jgi:drug/metabolite transporter (DMT)-like permease
MENLRGIGLMVLAMACFTLTDSLIKAASVQLPIGQIMVLTGIGGSGVFALLALKNDHAVLARDFFLKPVILRNLAEIAGSIGFITALSLIDLSTASAVMQATPLAVTLGAVVLLKETVHWRRWSAILAGFVGVMLIIRNPGVDGYRPETLWAVFGMLALSIRDLATRMIPATVPGLRISAYGMMMIVVAGLILLAADPVLRPVGMVNGGRIAVAVLSGSTGYLAITTAMRLGDVAVIAPFRYARILFALLAGVFYFGERPGGMMLLGAAITILAGIYTFMRERRRSGRKV